MFSEYTVNAMDAEELRKSQRRLKKAPAGGLKGLSKGTHDALATPSQESDDLDDDEEDDPATPSAEHAERNMMSMLSVRCVMFNTLLTFCKQSPILTYCYSYSTYSIRLISSENVDIVGRREHFLKSNFESLSGMEDVAGSPGMNNSISNKYKSGDSAVARNAKTIARAQSFRDDEQNRKREELQRRIEETRKKLQNVSIAPLKKVY